MIPGACVREDLERKYQQPPKGHWVGAASHMVDMFKYHSSHPIFPATTHTIVDWTIEEKEDTYHFLGTLENQEDTHQNHIERQPSVYQQLHLPVV